MGDFAFPPPKKILKKLFDNSFFWKNIVFVCVNLLLKNDLSNIFFNIFYGGGMQSRILEFRFQMPYHPQKKRKTKNKQKNIKKKYLTNHFLTVTFHIQRLYFHKK